MERNKNKALLLVSVCCVYNSSKSLAQPEKWRPHPKNKLKTRRKLAGHDRRSVKIFPFRMAVAMYICEFCVFAILFSVHIWDVCECTKFLMAVHFVLLLVLQCAAVVVATATAILCNIQCVCMLVKSDGCSWFGYGRRIQNQNSITTWHKKSFMCSNNFRKRAK